MPNKDQIQYDVLNNPIDQNPLFTQSDVPEQDEHLRTDAQRVIKAINELLRTSTGTNDTVTVSLDQFYEVIGEFNEKPELVDELKEYNENLLKGVVDLYKKFRDEIGNREDLPEAMQEMTVIEMINNIETIISETPTTKELLIDLMAPLSLGVEAQSETFIPLKGEIVKTTLYISTESTTSSNIIVGVQEFRNNSWHSLYSVNKQNGVYQTIYEHNPPVEINNTRIRVNIIDGMVAGISKLGILLTIKTKNN